MGEGGEVGEMGERGEGEGGMLEGVEKVKILS